jgi:hypothetical protein
MSEYRPCSAPIALIQIISLNLRGCLTVVRNSIQFNEIQKKKKKKEIVFK